MAGDVMAAGPQHTSDGQRHTMGKRRWRLENIVWLVERLWIVKVYSLRVLYGTGQKLKERKKRRARGKEEHCVGAGPP